MFAGQMIIVHFLLEKVSTKNMYCGAVLKAPKQVLDNFLVVILAILRFILCEKRNSRFNVIFTIKHYFCCSLILAIFI